MPTKEEAISIVDGFLRHGEQNGFSCVGVKAYTINKIFQEQYNDSKLNAMPTCCHALEHHFQAGKDFFRRGKDRFEWSSEIDGEHTSTFEVLFVFPR